MILFYKVTRKKPKQNTQPANCYKDDKNMKQKSISMGIKAKKQIC